MKNILIFFFSLGTILLSAQNESNEVIYPTGGESEFGVFLAYNSSFLTKNGFTEYEGIDAGSGPALGFQYEYYFSKSWSIRGRAIIDYKGYEFENLEDEALDLWYVTVPVVANWHFGTKKRWYVHFGPYIGFRLAAEYLDENVKDNFDSIEYGSDIAVGVRIPAKKGKYFFIETGGQNSFSDPSNPDLQEDGITLARTNLAFGLIF